MATNMPMGFGFPTPPGIPSYPGTPALNAMPGLQYNPTFDGLFAHGLTTNPYSNALFEDLNTMQTMIYNQNPVPLGFPPLGPIPMQAGFTPPTGMLPTGNAGALRAPNGSAGGPGGTLNRQA